MTVLLGGLLVTVITRVTAFVLLRWHVDVNKVWYDEIIGLKLGLLVLYYFGNDWLNLLIFASAELVPMGLQRRPKPEEIPMVEEVEIPMVTEAMD